MSISIKMMKSGLGLLLALACVGPFAQSSLARKSWNVNESLRKNGEPFATVDPQQNDGENTARILGNEIENATETPQDADETPQERVYEVDDHMQIPAVLVADAERDALAGNSQRTMGWHIGIPWKYIKDGIARKLSSELELSGYSEAILRSRAYDWLINELNTEHPDEEEYAEGLQPAVDVLAPRFRGPYTRPLTSFLDSELDRLLEQLGVELNDEINAQEPQLSQDLNIPDFLRLLVTNPKVTPGAAPKSFEGLKETLIDQINPITIALVIARQNKEELAKADLNSAKWDGRYVSGHEMREKLACELPKMIFAELNLRTAVSKRVSDSATRHLRTHLPDFKGVHDIRITSQQFQELKWAYLQRYREQLVELIQAAHSNTAHGDLRF